MTRRALRATIDEGRVLAAIETAESRTSGEIRTALAPYFWGSVRTAAERAFDRLGMRDTKRRNGVLVFLAPARRKFAVVGDSGIHAVAGQELWDRAKDAMEARFRDGDFTGGLEHGIRLIGDALAQHFPPEPDDADELSDAIDYAE